MSSPALPSDAAWRGLLPELGIRLTWTHLSAAANEAVLRHDCDPPAALILCRALAAGASLSPLLEEGQIYTLSWQYSGPLRKCVVDAQPDGHLRGYIATKRLYGQAEDIPSLYGDKGSVSLVRSDARRILNSGIVNAHLFDICDDLAFAFSTSDQIETHLIPFLRFAPDVSRPVSLCQILLLQALPDADLVAMENLAKALRQPELASFTQRPLTSRKDLQDLLYACAPYAHLTPLQLSAELHASPAPLWCCSCNREKTSRSIATLGTEDLKATAAKGETLRVTCQFCSKIYSYAPEELEAIAAHL